MDNTQGKFAVACNSDSGMLTVLLSLKNGVSSKNRSDTVVPGSRLNFVCLSKTALSLQ